MENFYTVHLGIGEVNITFNVNPSCRTAASEIQFLQRYFVITDSSGIILALANHTIQLVYNVLGCGALVEAQCSIPSLHEKACSRRADLCNRYYSKGVLLVDYKRFTYKYKINILLLHNIILIIILKYYFDN